MTDGSARLAAALADRYRIERELGAGGMATVYLAEDIKHDRQVAIKVLREDLSASLGSGRFLREIKIAAQLQHPHILPLLDSGEADGFLFFVMPYIKGQSLRERLAREGELPVHEAVRLITEVVDALVEAHAHGVVHRDIKPDNVMLSGRHALVTDFGVAKAISEATGRNTVTTLGVAVGTPTYMSPEQAAADPHVDHRSDIYSVGVMAYEMLSSRPPFTGSTPQQVLAAHVTEAPDSVSKRRPAIPAAVEAVVMRCLAKRPADRFQTAADLHAALEPLATPSAGVTPTHTQPVPAVRSRRSMQLLSGLAAVAVLAGAAWLVANGRWGSSARGALPPAIQVTSTGEATDAAISPDGSRVAYSVKHCDAAGRCLFDLLVQDVRGAGTLTVTSGATKIDGAAWSPDGRYLLITESRNGAHGTYLVPASVEGPSRLIAGGDVEFVVTADTVLITPESPVTDSVIWLRIATTVDGAVRDSILVRHPAGYLAAIASRDGRWIALFETTDAGGRFRIIGRDGREVDRLNFGNLTNADFDDTGIHWTLMSTTSSNSYDLLHQSLNWRTGRRHGAVDTILSQFKLYTGGAGLAVGAFSVTPDLRTLAYVQGTPLNAVVTLRRPALASNRFDVRVVDKSTSTLNGLVSPDGSSILLLREELTGTEHTRIQLSLVPYDGGAEQKIAPLLDSIAEITWAGGGTPTVLYGVTQADRQDHVFAYDAASRQSRALFTLPHIGFQYIDRIAAGRYVVCRFDDSVATVLSADGKPERRLHLPIGIVVSGMAAAPDGTSLAVYGTTISGDSVVVFALRLADGTTSRLGAFAGANGKVTGWRTDDEMLVSIRETAETAALYDVFTDGRPATRIGILPSGIGYSSATDGLRLATMTIEPHSDIWLMRDAARLFRP